MTLKNTKHINKMTLPKLIKGLFSQDTPNYIRLIIGLALAYTVLPVDMLPDLLGPLGFVDDAAVIGLLTTIAMQLLDHHKQTAEKVAVSRSTNDSIIEGDKYQVQ